MHAHEVESFSYWCFGRKQEGFFLFLYGGPSVLQRLPHALMLNVLWVRGRGGWVVYAQHEWITRWMIHTKLNACREKLSVLWNISSSMCCGVLTLDSDSLWSAVEVISGQGILTPSCDITAASCSGYSDPWGYFRAGGIDAWLSSSLLLHVRDIVIPEVISGQGGLTPIIIPVASVSGPRQRLSQGRRFGCLTVIITAASVTGPLWTLSQVGGFIKQGKWGVGEGGCMLFNGQSSAKVTSGQHQFIKSRW